MKKFLMIGCLVSTLLSMESCKNKPETWEYKVVKVAGKEAEYREDFGSLVFSDQSLLCPILKKGSPSLPSEAQRLNQLLFNKKF